MYKRQEVKFKDGTSKVLYVSDVNNIEKTMTKAGYTDYTVADLSLIHI